jgi:hypothetical protein
MLDAFPRHEDIDLAIDLRFHPQPGLEVGSGTPTELDSNAEQVKELWWAQLLRSETKGAVGAHRYRNPLPVRWHNFLDVEDFELKRLTIFLLNGHCTPLVTIHSYARRGIIPETAPRQCLRLEVPLSRQHGGLREAAQRDILSVSATLAGSLPGKKGPRLSAIAPRSP